MSSAGPGENARREASGRAIAALIFGILGLTALPCIGPIVAIVLGSGERDGIGRAGFLLGWIALVLYVAAAFFFLLFLLVGGGLAALSQ